MVLEKNILDSLLEWAKVQLLLLGEETNFEIEPLREEASSRKYFRLKLPNKSLVLVSSSSEIDSSLKFDSLSSEFLNKGINVPEVYSFDKSQGFMLIEDFGENLYQDLLNEENEQQFYESAFDELIKKHIGSNLRGPFNTEARLLSDFTRDEIQYLENPK